MKKVTATIEELAQLYLQGKTLEEIGQMFGVTREAIRIRFRDNGYVLRDLRSNIKVKKAEYKKKLANELLIESTNRQIKIFWDRARYSDQKYKNACQLLKKYRAVISEIKNYAQNALNAVDSELVDTTTYLKILNSIDKVNFYKQWKRSKDVASK